MEFAEVLKGMNRRGAPEETASAPRAGGDFWRVLDGFAQTSGLDQTATRAAYRANDSASRAAAFEPAPIRDGVPPSIDPSDIAFELGLDAVSSLDDLKLVRRLFARSNHPDRVPPGERDRANQRMTVANALIDAAATRFAR
ncbi:hypothetical protein [Aureimonas endophytica]|nr:hypothetical protein [Aureimonas endophytica]